MTSPVKMRYAKAGLSVWVCVCFVVTCLLESLPNVFSGVSDDTNSGAYQPRHMAFKHSTYLLPHYVNTPLELWNHLMKPRTNTSMTETITHYLLNYKNPCWFHGSQSVEGIRCLPYFYLLGVTKSGTTSLYQQLVKHPDVITPEKKEQFFWGFNGYNTSFPNYVSEFTNAAKQIYLQKDRNSSYHRKLTIDATPAYFTRHGPLHLIPGNNDGGEPVYTLADILYTVNPDTRFIVIMRNPTARLFSHYHHFHKPFSARDFHEHAEVAVMMMRTCLVKRTTRACVFDQRFNVKVRQGNRIALHFSMYYPYAKDWLSVFPRNQMLFLKAEEFYKNASEVLGETFNFLGLEQASDDVMQNISKTMSAKWAKASTEDSRELTYRSQMWNETKVMLDDFFAPLNRQLADLLSDEKWLFVSD